LSFGVHCHLGDPGLMVVAVDDRDDFGRLQVGGDKSYSCIFSGGNVVCVCVIMFMLQSSIGGVSEMLEGYDWSSRFWLVQGVLGWP